MKRQASALALVFASLVGVASCNRAAPSVSHSTQASASTSAALGDIPALASTAPIPDLVSPAAGARSLRLIKLEHDFGLVRPSSHSTHRFKLPNDEPIPWHVAGVSRNCACTVAEVTGEYIQVEYRSGGHRADDERELTVRFHEADSPVIRLVVKATVRSPVDASSREFNFNGTGKNYGAEEILEIRNFSDGDWESVAATCDAPWLSAAAELWRSEEHLGAERQVWRITVRADARQTKPGRYNSELVLKCQGKSLDEARIPVTLYMSGPVQPIPGPPLFRWRGGRRHIDLLGEFAVPRTTRP